MCLQQSLTGSYPIILDDSLNSYHAAYLLGETEERDEGLLAGTELSKDLLSMSGYGRSQYPDAKGKPSRALSTCDARARLFATQ